MALIGQIGEFNVDNEAVTAYLERLGLFLAANQVEGERKFIVAQYSVLNCILNVQLPKASALRAPSRTHPFR